MTERPTDEERAAMIAGDRAGALDPEELDDLALLRDVLADPSTWAEPSPGLEDAVVRAVGDAEAGSHDQRPGRRRWIVVAAAAAAAAAILIIGVVVATRGGGSTDYTAQLSATALAPRAHASADVTQTDAGFRITLDASGLPALPAGEYYQAWLKDAAGTLVPVGSFSSSDGSVTLWSGVSPKSFPTMTVTVEAVDNDQTSSGRRVLVGEMRAG